MNEQPTPESPTEETPEHQEELDDSTRIYVASLSDYNAGRLHGAWINANQDAEDLHAAIQHMLERSREPIAEEWAIHDYEGFGPLYLSEYESIEHVSRIAQGISEHGIAFAHWAEHLGSSEWQYLDRFDDSFIGHWSSRTEFAETFLEDTGVDVDSLVDEHLQSYVTFDMDAYARDLSYDFHIAEDNDGVYVFDNT